jgi:hypothetical protein
MHVLFNKAFCSVDCIASICTMIRAESLLKDAEKDCDWPTWRVVLSRHLTGETDEKSQKFQPQ